MPVEVSVSKYTKLLRWSLFAGSAYFLVVAAITIIATADRTSRYREAAHGARVAGATFITVASPN